MERLKLIGKIVLALLAVAFITSVLVGFYNAFLRTARSAEQYFCF